VVDIAEEPPRQLAPFVKNTMVEFLYPNGIPRQHQHSDTRLEDRSEESFWATATLDKIRSVWTCQVASTKLVGSNIKCNYQEVKKKTSGQIDRRRVSIRSWQSIKSQEDKTKLKWAPNTKLVTSFLYFLIYIH
jgi:hypothetical protein